MTGLGKPPSPPPLQPAPLTYPVPSKPGHPVKPPSAGAALQRQRAVPETPACQCRPPRSWRPLRGRPHHWTHRCHHQ